jgi:hypothetical protein
MRRFCTLVVASFLVAGVASRAHATPCPNLMLVVDKTGSMDQDPNGGNTHPTKWELARNAVIKIVNMFGDQVPFGIEVFSSDGFDNATCYADTMISIEPAHDTAAQIVALVNATSPEGGTNTGDAIKRAAVDPALMDMTRQNFIVLITDGDPNCNDGEPQYSVDQVTAAAKNGIHTFVVGFDGSGGVMPANLNNMAKAGLEPIMGCTGGQNSPCYYSASNAQKFDDAINSIINQVVGGEFGTMMCDDSCESNGCPMGQICTMDELNPKPHCVPDPCAGAMCDVTTQFCRDGNCVSACLSPCKASEKCIDGQCLPDPCKGVTCDTGNGEVCNPLTGQCVMNPCVNRTCATPTVCDIGTGNCVNNQCSQITCPAGTMCVDGGNCVAPGTAPNDPMAGKHASGCQLGRSGDVAGTVALSLILFGFFAIGRTARLRRR